MNKTHAQKWKIIKKGIFWNFYSRANGLCLELSGGLTFNKNNIHYWVDNNSNAHIFFLNPAPSLFNDWIFI